MGFCAVLLLTEKKLKLCSVEYRRKELRISVRLVVIRSG